MLSSYFDPRHKATIGFTEAESLKCKAYIHSEYNKYENEQIIPKPKDSVMNYSFPDSDRMANAEFEIEPFVH